jgi:hypothetical protein
VCSHLKKAAAAARTAKAGNVDVDSDDQPEGLELCRECHIAYSPFWTTMPKLHLRCQPRSDGDRGYAEFLNLIRGSCITQQQLDHYLSTANGVKYISKAVAMGMVPEDVWAL